MKNIFHMPLYKKLVYFCCFLSLFMAASSVQAMKRTLEEDHIKSPKGMERSNEFFNQNQLEKSSHHTISGLIEGPDDIIMNVLFFTKNPFVFCKKFNKSFRNWGMPIFPSTLMKDMRFLEIIEIHPHIISVNLSKNNHITYASLSALTALESLVLNDMIHDEDLYEFTKIKCLNLCLNNKINGTSFSRLTSLTRLALNHRITDDNLKQLTGLTHLNLGENQQITNAGILPLKNLTSLNSFNNQPITVSQLTKLIWLNGFDLRVDTLKLEGSITDNIFLQYKNLTSLDMESNTNITDNELRWHTKLTKLSLGNNTNITDGGLSCLKNLTFLDKGKNKAITDRGISPLTKLVCLSLGWYSKYVTDEGLSKLTNLRTLDVGDNWNVIGTAFGHLPNLTNLDLEKNTRIASWHISSLTNLRSLYRGSVEKISDVALKRLTNLTELDGFKFNKTSLKLLGHYADSFLLRFTNLTDLTLQYNEQITIEALRQLTKLARLNGFALVTETLKSEGPFTNASLLLFTNLTDFNVENNKNITNETLKKLTTLKRLNGFDLTVDTLKPNGNFSDQTLLLFTNLTYLDWKRDKNISTQSFCNAFGDYRESLEEITTETLSKLTGLRKLNLENNKCITYSTLNELTNLTWLNGYDLGGDTLKLDWNFEEDFLLRFTNLTSLNMANNQHITAITLVQLPNLTILDLGTNKKIDDNGLVELSNLTNLNLNNATQLTNNSLKKLIKLTSLDLGKNTQITIEGLKQLRSLSCLKDSDIFKLAPKQLPNLTSLNGKALYSKTNNVRTLDNFFVKK